MSYNALTPCVCGHVANHHGHRYGCAVAGCPCRKFDAGSVSLQHHNEVIRRANATIKALRAELRAALERGTE